MKNFFKALVVFCALFIVFAAVSSASDKEELAVHLLYEATVAGTPREKAVLFKRVADECAETAYAPEALWRLSQLYVDGFEMPDIPSAVKTLERFVTQYPNSEWFFNVQITLLGFYESEKDWRKFVVLGENVLKNKDMPQNVRGEISRRVEEAKKK